MPSILFVCRANQFRSPIAAALLRKTIKLHNYGKEWIVDSAGTWTTEGLSFPANLLAMANKLNIPGLSKHRSRQISKELIKKFDLIIVMEAGQKEALVTEFPAENNRIFLFSKVVDGSNYDISDPVIPGVDPVMVAEQICLLITGGFQNILTLATLLNYQK